MVFCVSCSFQKGTTIGGRRENEENLELKNCDGAQRVKLLEKLHFIIMGGIFFFFKFLKEVPQNATCETPFALSKLKKKNSQFFKRYLRFHRVQPKHLDTPHKEIMLLREEIAALFNVLMAPHGLSKGVFLFRDDLSNLTCRFFFFDF